MIEPVFEAAFRPTSYGFRPGRGCHDALREVDRLLKDGFTFVVDADLEGYFDSIPHERLMERIGERISDGRVLGLIRGWLGQDILRGVERWTPVAGTPQGAVISPLLANIYLDPLDERMAARGHRMVRYADDFVVLCESRDRRPGFEQCPVHREVVVGDQPLHLRLSQHGLEELGRDLTFQQPVAVLREGRVVPHRIVHAKPREPAEQKIELNPLHQLTLGPDPIERL